MRLLQSLCIILCLHVIECYIHNLLPPDSKDQWALFGNLKSPHKWQTPSLYCQKRHGYLLPHSSPFFPCNLVVMDISTGRPNWSARSQKGSRIAQFVRVNFLGLFTTFTDYKFTRSAAVCRIKRPSWCDSVARAGVVSTELGKCDRNDIYSDLK